MAPKKKSKKKQTRSKRVAGKKRVPAKKTATLKKKSAISKTKAAKKKTAVAKKSAPRRRARGRSQSVETAAFSLEASRSGRQSGDLQGLSSVEQADSESVDELVEEGNAFEADAVSGVEGAGDTDEKEVHTHEVPEDDVPEEYLDKD